MFNPHEQIMGMGFSDAGLKRLNGWTIYRHKTNKYFVGILDSYSIEQVKSAVFDGDLQFNRNTQPLAT